MSEKPAEPAPKAKPADLTAQLEALIDAAVAQKARPQVVDHLKEALFQLEKKG